MISSMNPLNSLQDSYSELIALTQLFLLREFPIKDELLTDVQTHAFFKKSILDSTKHQAKSAQTVKQEAKEVHEETTREPVRPQNVPHSPPLTNSLPPSKLPTPPIESTPLAEKPSTPTKAIKPETQPSKPATPDVTKAPLFNLEPLPPPVIPSHQEFKQWMKEHHPHFPLIEKPPSDHLAKKMKNAWQKELSLAPIVILAFNEQEKSLVFLKNIAQAITRHFAPAQVLSGLKIEQEKKWDALLKTPELRLVIASDYGLYLLPDLMKHYKESSHQDSKHYLDKTPLLLLSDLSLYLKEPQLKSLLWRAICNELRNFPNSSS